jgi:hypothetical protein
VTFRKKESDSFLVPCFTFFASRKRKVGVVDK